MSYSVEVVQRCHSSVAWLLAPIKHGGCPQSSAQSTSFHTLDRQGRLALGLEPSRLGGIKLGVLLHAGFAAESPVGAGKRAGRCGGGLRHRQAIWPSRPLVIGGVAGFAAAWHADRHTSRGGGGCVGLTRDRPAAKGRLLGMRVAVHATSLQAALGLR